jgi:hypothetical protein
MTDNAARYGFRFFRSRYSGLGNPPVREAWTATSASFDVNGGAANVVLGAGDPILQVSDGSVTLALGSETTDSTTILGVCCGIKQYYDTVKGVLTAAGPGIPSDLAWGTNLAHQSRLYYVPADAAIWAIQVDDIVTATTQATYEAFIGENCRMILTGASGELRAKPKLDISTHATTNTFPWKIVGVQPAPPNVDFSGANVELLVISNGSIASDNAILGI